jgi:hypothetical protein
MYTKKTMSMSCEEREFILITGVGKSLVSSSASGLTATHNPGAKLNLWMEVVDQLSTTLTLV